MLGHIGAPSNGWTRPSESRRRKGNGRNEPQKRKKGPLKNSPASVARPLLLLLPLLLSFFLSFFLFFFRSEWLLWGTVAPTWSSSDKSKLEWSREVRSLLELIWRVLHVNLRCYTPSLCFGFIGRPALETAVSQCKPHPVCNRAASTSILHRGSGRKGSVSSRMQPPGQGWYITGDIDWAGSAGGNLPGVVSASK